MKKSIKMIFFRSSEGVKKLAVCASALYFRMFAFCVTAQAAKDKGGSTADTGVSDVTSGIGVIKDLVLGCVGGVGVIFLAWGLLDFGTGYASSETTQQSQAIKKVVGGLIMVAVPAILKLLGVT